MYNIWFSVSDLLHSSLLVAGVFGELIVNKVEDTPNLRENIGL